MESKGTDWQILVATLHELMKIRPSESHGMLLSEIVKHFGKKKNKRKNISKKIVQRISQGQFKIDINSEW